MYQIDFTTPIHIHFIGIGGISMSGLAEILLEEGFTITGSDSKESPLTRHQVVGRSCEFIIGDILGCIHAGKVFSEGYDTAW